MLSHAINKRDQFSDVVTFALLTKVIVKFVMLSSPSVTVISNTLEVLKQTFSLSGTKMLNLEQKNGRFSRLSLKTLDVHVLFTFHSSFYFKESNENNIGSIKLKLFVE